MARKARFANNASSRLAANLSSIGTTCSVTPGEGAKFPTLSAGQFFMATLVKADGTKEVVKVTARATDTFTIARAAEPVGAVQTAYAFSAGDRIELRMTAVALGDELDRLDLAAIARVSNKSANYTVLAADLNTLFRVDSSGGARTISLPSIAATGDEFKVLVAKITNDANIVTIAANGSDTINGLSTLSLTQQWAGAWLIADKATNTWTAINSGSSSGNWVIDAFTGSGTDGPFTLSGDPGSKNNTMVWVGGVYQNKASYTLVGTSLTLGGTVAAGVPIEVAWAAPIAFGVPNDGSVTTAKIGDGAVTTPKILDRAVTAAKLLASATARIWGRTTAGSGDVEQLTGTQVQALLPIQQVVENVASAATVVVPTNTDHLNITGTNTITGFTIAAGRTLFVRFAGSLTLTSNANIGIQNGANIVTQAGDTCILRATAANVVEVLSYREARWVSSPGAAPMYACRAWVNFDGTFTPSIRASGNVSSITDNGPGDYTVNFVTSMPDANYALVIAATLMPGSSNVVVPCIGRYNNTATAKAASNAIVSLYPSGPGSGGSIDSPNIDVAVFR